MIITKNEREYIVNNMTNVLKTYGHDHQMETLDKIVTEWSVQKETLINAFKKHPNYVDGKFMIAFIKDYERPMNEAGAANFSYWLDNFAICQYYKNHPDVIKERTKEDGCSWLPNRLYRFLTELNHYTQRCISEETAKMLENDIPEIHPHAGQKTSRVVNKICTFLGYDKLPDYNKEFAKYADSLSPMKVKRHTVLSINPLDYLTMSFGNSWSSCHTIDNKNIRRMPSGYHGMQCSGTMSYMLDKSSMVLYTLDSTYNADEYWNEPKIIRQMFHYGEDKLVQARLYPQDNDGCSDAYEPYRQIVQEIMSTIFEFPNLWTLSKGTDKADRAITSQGTHYRDYLSFNNVTVSKVKGSENDNKFVVGADPICIFCGKRHRENGSLKCFCRYNICTTCGCVIEYDDDIITIDGRSYCRDCVK